MLSIGEFARATHLSVKTLRYYHDAGLLVPAGIDAHSGYRRYDVEQIGTAQVIRRFRDLGMPVEDVRTVLHTPISPPGTSSSPGICAAWRRTWKRPRRRCRRCTTCSSIP